MTKKQLFSKLNKSEVELIDLHIELTQLYDSEPPSRAKTEVGKAIVDLNKARGFLWSAGARMKPILR